MKEQRITFKTAKLAKEKGFHWRTLQKGDPPYTGTLPRLIVSEGPGEEHNNPCFSENGKEITPKYYEPRNPHYPRPTQSLLQKWLREKHGIHVLAGPIREGKWDYFICNLVGINIGEDSEDSNYSTYEECFEAVLYEALKLIKDETV